MVEILTLNKIAACGTDKFDKGSYNVSDNAANPAGIMVRSAAMHDMTFGSDLLAIARAGAGVNNIPVERCAGEGIVVFNTPGANANAVKELVIAALLMSSRKLTEGVKWAESLKGNGDEVVKMVEKGKSAFAGPEIYGKTLGIIGMGAIGALAGNAAMSLGMKVIGYDPYLSVKAALSMNPGIKMTNDISELYANSDYVTIHTPYTPETKGTINENTIAQMKDGVRILNLARGELVDTAATKSALASGKVAAYVVDFPTEEMLGTPGVTCLPHLGASTPEAEDNCAVMAAEELIEYLERGNIRNSVNFPNAELNAAGTKIVVLHKNVPAVISEITSILGTAGINISNMISPSKGNFACTLIDAEGDITEDIKVKLSAPENVVRVRVIK
ncbi:MAG: 3-phosphoglycerate dehydrogenase [Oscillospiraceae bacterium]|nr:3-phosphoglycerate dehydrogenase [Oscillospiraceae bacterium]